MADYLRLHPGRGQRPARTCLIPPGGPSLLADPSLIQRRYRDAVDAYLDQLNDIVNHSVIDYHRTFLDEPYDQVLARFLMGRNPKTARSAK